MAVSVNGNGKKKVNLATLGSPGLKQWGGIIHEEWLAELKGNRWTTIIKQMVDGDAIVGGILHAVTMLIRQVDWEVVAAEGESNEAERAAEHVRQCFEDMEVPFGDCIAELLNFLPYGWNVSEILYKLRFGDDGEPTKNSMYNDGMVGWRRFATRPQDTLNNWEFTNGYCTALIQADPVDGKLKRVPLSKAIHLKTTTNKDNPEGKSILRNSYRSWYFKRNIENIEAIGIERDLAGLPVLGIPPEWLEENASEDEQRMLLEAKAIVTGIKRDENEGVVLPLMYDDRGNKLIELQLMTSGGQRQFDTSVVVERYDRSMAMSVLADFMMLGHKNVGSFALSATKTTMFALAITAWMDFIQEAVRKQAIIPLMRYNGFPIALAPNLKHSDIGTRDLAQLATYIKELTAAGAPLFPNPRLEAFLLDQAGLPVPTDAERAQQERELEKDAQIEELAAQNDMLTKKAQQSALKPQPVAKKPAA